MHEKQSEAFHLTHVGYRMREFLADPIDDEQLDWMLDAGAATLPTRLFQLLPKSICALTSSFATSPARRAERGRKREGILGSYLSEFPSFIHRLDFTSIDQSNCSYTTHLITETPSRPGRVTISFFPGR